MSPRPYVPVIGSAMLHVVVSLIEKLEHETTTVGYPNEVQTSPWENGLCTSIIALAAMILESAVNRARFIRRELGRIDAAEFFRQATKDVTLSSSVEEIFVVRDLVAHNHIWDTEVADDSTGPLRFKKPPKLVPSFGDKKYERCVDQNTRQTLTLHLNAFPTRIWRNDVLTVMSVLDFALAALDRLDPEYFGANIPVTFHGECITFPKAVARMKRTKLGM